MAQKIGDAFVEISARLDKFTKQIDGASLKVQKSFQKVSKKLDGQFDKLGATIAGAFAVQKIAQFTSEAIKLASVAEGVKSAFDRLNDPMLLDNLKEATRGTVSELELMKSAVQAKNLGVPVKNLASLFEFATQRAADTGEAVDYLVQSIVTGICRKSPLILDNLGISAIDLKAQLNCVGLETASVGEIAEAVGKIASKSLKDIGDTSLTSAQSISIMTARIADLQVKLGENVMPAYLFVLETLDSAFDGLKATIGQLKKVYQDFLILTGQQAEYTEESLRNQMNLNKAFALGLFATRQYVDENGKLNDSQIDVLNSNYDLVTSFNNVTEAQKSLETQTEKTKTSLSGFPKESTPEIAQKGITQVGSVGGLGEGATLSTITAEGLQPLIDKTNELSEAQQFGSGIAMDFGFALQDSLQGALEGSENFFESMFEYLVQLVIKLGTAVAAAFALKAILGTITGGATILKELGGVGGLIGTFSGLGGALEFGGKVRGNDLYIANQRTGNTRGRIGG